MQYLCPTGFGAPHVTQRVSFGFAETLRDEFASCPSGKLAIGGGGRVLGGSTFDPAPAALITESYPSDDGKEWYVSAVNTGVALFSPSIEVIVICATILTP